MTDRYCPMCKTVKTTADFTIDMAQGDKMNNKQIENNYYEFKRTLGELLFPFQRTPIQAEGLPESARKVWRFVIAGILLVTLLCAATVYLIGG